MKIVFSCSGMSKGGAERVISTLANEMCKGDNEVSIITFINYKIKYELDNKINLITIDKIKMKKLKGILSKFMKLSPARLFRYKKEILKLKPDIIISFLPEPSLRLMLLKKFSKKISKIPTIISIRNDPNIEYKNKYLRNIVKNLYKDVDGMVFQTPDAKKYFEDLLNKKKNMFIIPNPINNEFILNKVIYDREKTIVTMSRLESQKNHLLLIDAFEKLHKKYSDYILKIYGDGSLKYKLEQYAYSKKMENSIKFIGQVDKVKEHIEKSGMFVLTSNYEGMPNSLMEAMALGIPCISTDCPVGGPRMLIDNNINGILVDVNNKEQLFEAMDKIISDKDFANKLSENAMSSIKKYYPDKINKEWEKFIIKVLASKV